MDASAYLQRHGWKGLGHSLDAHSENPNGLKKPLLISKKVDVLGIGIKKHDVIADQWWMKAFDAGLRDLGTGKKSLLQEVQTHGHKRGGLYGRFVRGEGVPGTIGVVVDADGRAVEVREVGGVDVAEGPKKKRKADGEGKGESKKRKKEDKERKAVKRGKESAVATPASTDSEAGRTKAERRAEKEKKKASRAEKENARAARKASKAAREPETSSGSTSAAESSESTARLAKKLAKLPSDKRQQYAARAAEKGVTLEEYYARRVLKNQEARKEKTVA